MKTYRIKEIFGPTLQGEGTWAGQPVLFLRFVGCNRWTGLEKDRDNAICKFCDTDFRGGTAMTLSEIITKLAELSNGGTKRVVITGGEPTLQVDLDFCKALTGQRYKLHLETNGSRAMGEFHQYFDHITMSPKQSLEETKLECCDDLKILYPPIHPDITMEKFSSFERFASFLQPVWDKDYEANVKATICRILGNPEWRLSLQTHKIVGVQ